MPTPDQAGAILTIDLGAIRENYRRLRAQLGGGRCAGVVKADGYGLGASEVAQVLREEGCSDFFVAHVAEGLSLRAALGPEADIYVLNGIPSGAEQACASAELIAVCNSLEQLRAWRDMARQLGRTLPVVVQVDSGMSRLGLSTGEVDALAADAQAFDGLALKLVMSHLACADEPRHPANAAQLANFEAQRRKLPDAPASLANSSGIFLGPAYHFDLARPGAALYGINPTPGLANPMKPVIALSAKVVQTREIGASTGVGYAHALIAPGAMRLATISLGYADGWPRSAAGTAWFEGVPLGFAGRVSMDSIILDISALVPGRLKPDDLVELIGPSQGVEDVAAMAGTIGYEILTSLGKRFHRRYLRG